MSTRTDDEIDDQMSRAVESDSSRPGGGFPGMTYEQGVDAALRWVTGLTDDVPMENNDGD